MSKTYYEHAGITIFHGDCREVIEQWEGLRTQSFDLLLTDPPYGLASKLSGGTWGAKFAGGLSWDQQTPALDAWRTICRSSIIWGGNYFALPPSRCWFVWFKPDAVRTMASVDLAWTSFDQPSRLLSYSIAATNKERGDHPTPKPLALMAWCLEQTERVTTILDPFMGSGTTLLAAKRLGRRAIGVEREEKYCEIAAKRLSQEALPLEMGDASPSPQASLLR